MTAALKDRQAALRREHVLEAAVRVFAASGFRNATMRQVAAEAGVAEGTVYNAFESKDALLLAILEPLLVADGPPPGPVPATASPPALAELFVARWAQFTPELLARLRIVLAEVLVNPSLRATFVERAIRPPLTGLQAPLERLNQQREGSSRDVSAIARLHTAAFFGLLLMRLLDEEIASRPGDAAQMAQLLQRGLSPPVVDA